MRRLQLALRVAPHLHLVHGVAVTHQQPKPFFMPRHRHRQLSRAARDRRDGLEELLIVIAGSRGSDDRRAGLLALIKLGGGGAADDRLDGCGDELIVMAGLE